MHKNYHDLIPGTLGQMYFMKAAAELATTVDPPRRSDGMLFKSGAPDDVPLLYVDYLLMCEASAAAGAMVGRTDMWIRECWKADEGGRFLNRTTFRTSVYDMSTMSDNFLKSLALRFDNPAKGGGTPFVDQTTSAALSTITVKKEKDTTIRPVPAITGLPPSNLYPTGSLMRNAILLPLALAARGIGLQFADARDRVMDDKSNDPFSGVTSGFFYLPGRVPSTPSGLLAAMLKRRAVDHGAHPNKIEVVSSGPGFFFTDLPLDNSPSGGGTDKKDGETTEGDKKDGETGKKDGETGKKDGETGKKGWDTAGWSSDYLKRSLSTEEAKAAGRLRAQYVYNHDLDFEMSSDRNSGYASVSESDAARSLADDADRALRKERLRKAMEAVLSVAHGTSYMFIGDQGLPHSRVEDRDIAGRGIRMRTIRSSGTFYAEGEKKEDEEEDKGTDDDTTDKTEAVLGSDGKTVLSVNISVTRCVKRNRDFSVNEGNPFTETVRDGGWSGYATVLESGGEVQSPVPTMDWSSSDAYVGPTVDPFEERYLNVKYTDLGWWADDSGAVRAGHSNGKVVLFYRCTTSIRRSLGDFKVVFKTIQPPGWEPDPDSDNKEYVPTYWTSYWYSGGDLVKESPAPDGVTLGGSDYLDVMMSIVPVVCDFHVVYPAGGNADLNKNALVKISRHVSNVVEQVAAADSEAAKVLSCLSLKQGEAKVGLPSDPDLPEFPESLAVEMVNQWVDKCNSDPDNVEIDNIMYDEAVSVCEYSRGCSWNLQLVEMPYSSSSVGTVELGVRSTSFFNPVYYFTDNHPLYGLIT